MIRSAIETLRTVQLGCLSTPVLYRTRDGETKPIQAIVGKTVFHSRGDYGTWTRTETRDFIVKAEALETPPAPGDEIVFDGRTYEVLAPNNEPVWRWSDPWCTARRIHTKWTGGSE
ncbi:MAG: hypothetical protein ACI4RA_10930 [Kiritimatiellia bacterium]